MRFGSTRRVTNLRQREAESLWEGLQERESSHTSTKATVDPSRRRLRQVLGGSEQARTEHTQPLRIAITSSLGRRPITGLERGPEHPAADIPPAWCGDFAVDPRPYINARETDDALRGFERDGAFTFPRSETAKTGGEGADTWCGSAS